MRYSKFIVALVILLNTGFALSVLYVFLKTGNEPTVLTGAWFTFTTGELWMIGSIRKFKVKHAAQKEGESGV